MLVKNLNVTKLNPFKHLLILGLFLSLTSFKGCFGEDENPGNGGGSKPAKYKVVIENITAPKKYFTAGAFKIPVGDDKAGPATPGKMFKFSFYAPKGSMLSFASMFGQSNDVFYAPVAEGIPLYNGNNPLSGNITDQVLLWDAGTEVNEEPGAGPNQAPRQPAPNTGVMENGTVKLITSTTRYPAVSDVLEVMLNYLGNAKFEVVIKNISTSSTLQTSIGPMPAPNSPGVYVVHKNGMPLFTVNEPAMEFIERIAEDGNPTVAEEYFTSMAGYVSPFSPGTWSIHKAGIKPLFTKEQAYKAEGLEQQAEDGNPTALSMYLHAKSGIKSTGIFNTPVGKLSPSPAFPGDKFEFEVEASKGDKLSISSMLGESNDIFLAFNEEGYPIGENTIVDATNKIYLWDAGTEVNEYPGAGLYQAPRQGMPNTGPSENNPVEIIPNAKEIYQYPSIDQIVKITIIPVK